MSTTSGASYDVGTLVQPVHGQSSNPQAEVTAIEGRAKRNTRQTYPVPMVEGGRGTSAWARGGEDNLRASSDLPHRGENIEDDPSRLRKRESKVDSPLLAASRAAAAYGLPALRESPGNKRHSHQVGRHVKESMVHR